MKPQQLARLPGSFQAAAWLSLAATALVAAEPSGLSVFCRAPDGRWLQGPKLAAPDGPGVPGLWLSLHAFANAVPVAAESSHALRSECTGFALRSDGYLGLWRVSLQAGPAQPPAFEWVGQAEISGATCATPLVRAAGCNGRLGRATARRLCLLGQTLTVHSGWHSALCRRWCPHRSEPHGRPRLGARPCNCWAFHWQVRGPPSRGAVAGAGATVGEIVSCDCEGSLRMWVATSTGPSSVALAAHRPLLLGSAAALGSPLAGTTTPLVPSMVRATAGAAPRVAVLLKAAVRPLC